MAKKRKVKPARSVGVELLRWLCGLPFDKLRAGPFDPAQGKARGRPVRQPPKQSVPAPAKGAPKGAVEVTADAYMHKLTPEARAILEAQEKTVAEVRKFVEEHPEEASQLLRAWLSRGKRE